MTGRAAMRASVSSFSHTSAGRQTFSFRCARSAAPVEVMRIAHRAKPATICGEEICPDAMARAVSSSFIGHLQPTDFRRRYNPENPGSASLYVRLVFCTKTFGRSEEEE